MSSDTVVRQTPPCVTIYWGCCAGCTLYLRYPRILWVTTHTALFNPIFFFQIVLTSPCQGSDPGSFGEINYEKRRFAGGGVAVANFPEGLLNHFRGAAQCPVDRSWCAQRCCDGATELRQSRC